MGRKDEISGLVNAFIQGENVEEAAFEESSRESGMPGVSWESTEEDDPNQTLSSGQELDQDFDEELQKMLGAEPETKESSMQIAMILAGVIIIYIFHLFLH